MSISLDLANGRLWGERFLPLPSCCGALSLAAPPPLNRSPARSPPPMWSGVPSSPLARQPHGSGHLQGVAPGPGHCSLDQRAGGVSLGSTTASSRCPGSNVAQRKARAPQGRACPFSSMFWLVGLLGTGKSSRLSL